MPIYEYVCKECHKGFEALVRGSSVPQCPSCRSTSLDRQLSVFALGPGQLTTSPMPAGYQPPCGTFGDSRGLARSMDD
jgi:putative FmdB family regulatory protein